MKHKKIIILTVLFIAIAGFTLSPVSSAKTQTTVTKMDMWNNEYTLKDTKKYYLSKWKPEGYGGYPITNIYSKSYIINTKKSYWGDTYIYTSKLKKSHYGGAVKTKSEKYKITVRKRDSMKIVKTYTKTLKPGQKFNIKLPKGTWVSHIKVTSKYTDTGKW